MVLNEDDVYEIMRQLDVNYVLVVFGGIIGYFFDDINKYGYQNFVMCYVLMLLIFLWVFYQVNVYKSDMYLLLFIFLIYYICVEFFGVGLIFFFYVFLYCF